MSVMMVFMTAAYIFSFPKKVSYLVVTEPYTTESNGAKKDE